MALNQTETVTVTYYGDYSPDVQGENCRTWGVQLVIIKNGQIFFRPDGDATNRVEAQCWEDEVYFPTEYPRLNSAGGGKKENETLEQCALREMKAELGIEGEGKLKVMEELPVVACGQIKDVDGEKKAALMGVVLAAYEPTEQEWGALEGMGQKVRIEKFLEDAAHDETLSFRPTYRTALMMGKLFNEKNMEGISVLVGGMNLLITEAMINYCDEEQIPLKRGIFGNI